MHPRTKQTALGAGLALLALLALLAAQAAIRTSNVVPVSAITAPSANAGFAIGSSITITPMPAMPMAASRVSIFTMATT